MPDVKRITPETVRKAYGNLATGSAYYLREHGGRDSMKGLYLRVLRTQVQIGFRSDRGNTWNKVAVVPIDIGPEELDTLRAAVRKELRELEDAEEEPSLLRGRHTTIRQLWETYRADYERRRTGVRSPRTLEFYDFVWACHILPLFGELTLTQFAALAPTRLQGIPEEVASRVRESRPWAKGAHTGNHVLRSLKTVWEFARRRGWIAKDPFVEVDELETAPADVYLEDADLGAIGEALRHLEALARKGSEESRQVPSLRSLLALRVVLYTGCRHRAELCEGKLGWLLQDYGIPRLAIPRAKGDRGTRKGRVLYLGPDALRCLLEMPRPEGCDDLVPGRVPDTQLNRLTDAWERVLLEARRILEDRGCSEPSAILRARVIGYQGEKRVALFDGPIRIPVKATRHTAKTIHPRAGISPDHSRQLLGHEAASLGDRVYLHQHGASLSEAAEKAETFIRRLMGDLDRGVLSFRRTGA